MIVFWGGLGKYQHSEPEHIYIITIIIPTIRIDSKRMIFIVNFARLDYTFFSLILWQKDYYRLAC